MELDEMGNIVKKIKPKQERAKKVPSKKEPKLIKVLYKIYKKSQITASAA